MTREYAAACLAIAERTLAELERCRRRLSIPLAHRMTVLYRCSLTDLTQPPESGGTHQGPAVGAAGPAPGEDYRTPEQAGLTSEEADLLDPDRPDLSGHGRAEVLDPYRSPGYVGDCDPLPEEGDGDA